MSGIVGLWNPDGRPAAPEEIARMVEAIAHRGPDGRRILVDGPAALGYLHFETRTRPLPIVQPFADTEAGLVLVLDGRIDNREELESELESRGLAVRGGSDAELILRAYQLWGVECPGHLLGDFAFAIWDSRNRRFFCARDQMGVKPFVYHYAQTSLFAFSNEINGIIALDRVPRRLNEYRLADYLVEELDRQDTVGTFYEGIQRLPGGHCLVAERDSIRVWRYWKPVLKEDRRYRSLKECADAFRALLMKATSDRIRDTDRIACALSGGLDSTSVVGAARELLGGPTKANLATFSLVDHGGQDALDMIRSVADQGGIDSHLVWPEDVTVENFDLAGFIRNCDEPFDVDQGWFDWISYRAAHENGSRVFFDGYDGDQMHPHANFLGTLIRTGHWLAAIRDARQLSEDWKLSSWRMLARSGIYPAFPRATCGLIKLKRRIWKPSGDSPIEWIDEDLARRTCVAERIADRRQALLIASRDRLLLHSLAFTTGLVSFALEYFDKCARLQSLELRHPLWDRRVAEFLTSLPLQQKVQFPASKNIMRMATSDLLPEPVLRQRRLPHPGPAFHAHILESHGEWFQASSQRAVDSLRGYVNMKSALDLRQRFQSEKLPEVSYPLWNVAVLADWMDMKKLGG